MKELVRFSAAVAALVAGSATSFAQTVPDGYNLDTLDLSYAELVNGIPVSSSFTDSTTGPISVSKTLTGVTGSLDVVNTPVPGIHLSTVFNTSATAGARATVDEFTRYYFTIVGPGSTASVLINATGGVGFNSVNPLDNTSIQASFTLHGNQAPFVISDSLYMASGGGIISDAQGHFALHPFDQFSIANSFTLSTNVVYEVTLSANISAILGGAGPESEYAFVDPSFAISDPGYRIVLSDGFGNGIAGAVPEMSTWGMMILGFAGVGVAACRRKSRPRPIAA
jgi:hypothetical protein